jgi:hypothetical protein
MTGDFRTLEESFRRFSSGRAMLNFRVTPDKSEGLNLLFRPETPLINVREEFVKVN